MSQVRVSGCKSERPTAAWGISPTTLGSQCGATHGRDRHLRSSWTNGGLSSRATSSAPSSAPNGVCMELIAGGGGSVVVVSSVDGWLAEQGLIAYACTKATLIAFARNLAVDHARDGIRANVVAPGTTDTPAFRRAMGTADRSDAGSRNAPSAIRSVASCRPMRLRARPGSSPARVVGCHRRGPDSGRGPFHILRFQRPGEPRVPRRMTMPQVSATPLTRDRARA